MAINRRQEVQVFSMSFIDCICCGFGAMILLLVLSQSKPPPVSEPVPQPEKGQSEELRLLGEKTAGELKGLEEALASSRDSQREAERELIRLRTTSNSLENKTTDAELDTKTLATVENQLTVAKQTLTEEMRRLMAQGVKRRNDAPVGGIPVDSEYIVFVIDTSGSMQRFAWSAMIKTMSEILDIYPRVKGIQVLSDEGGYLFSSYRGQWIPDSPSRRKATLDAIRHWQAFSDSSPVEGIEAAIKTFAAPDKKISVYVMGDDFTGNSAAAALKRIRRINPKDANGVPLARIHAIGFPTQHLNGGVTPSGIRFANLMRIMCRENGGAFIGLISNS